MTSAAAVARATNGGAKKSALPRRFRHPQDGNWHVQITQGETFVTAAADEVLTTVLGSCVAACIRDPEAGVGGMNHFLLPESGGDNRDALCYGINAMELLINGLMQHGGSRERMEAKIFGGARVMISLADIGARNGAFARRFLAEEGIRLLSADLGGLSPRRIEYWPLTGRARSMTVGEDRDELMQRELNSARDKRPTLKSESDDVELF